MNAIIYRILGNDLPPRHTENQTMCNTEFILKHEPPLEGAIKRWIINRIVDSKKEKALLDLLDSHRQEYFRLPFDLEEYKSCIKQALPENISYHSPNPNDLHRHNKILYVMNVNGARNRALDEGQKEADWTIPLDGGCCFTEKIWSEIWSKLLMETDLGRYFLVPTYRLSTYESYSGFDAAFQTEHESMIIFGRNNTLRFNPLYAYASHDKNELIRRMGLALKPSNRGGLVPAGTKNKIGYVVRLPSGDPVGDNLVKDRILNREAGINGLLKKLDLALNPPLLSRLLHRMLGRT